MMGFWQIIGAGWRGAFGAACRNSKLFIILFVSMAIIQLLLQLGAPAQSLSMQGQPFAIYPYLRDILIAMIYCCLNAPCMIAVHRFILLDETGGVFRNLHRLLVFVILLASVRVLPEIVKPLLMVYNNSSLGFGFVVYAIFMVLAFPAIALDVPNAVNDGVRRSYKRKGFIVGVMFFGVVLPSILLILVSLVLFVSSGNIDRFPGSDLVFLVVASIIGMATPIVAAGLASELFKKYGGLDSYSPYSR